MIETFGITFAAVLSAELLGDKCFYTTGLLATRYRLTPILAGLTLAFAIKMGAAVLFGDVLMALPRPLLAMVTVAGVLWVAVTFWREGERERLTAHPPATATQAFWLASATVLFSEWADLGQVTAAAMAAQFDAPLLVWSAAVAAMLAKGLVAATLGARLRGRLRDRLARPLLRYASVALLLILGGAAVAEVLFAYR